MSAVLNPAVLLVLVPTVPNLPRLSLKVSANFRGESGGVAGPVVAGAAAFLHTGICPGRVHHQHPLEGAAFQGDEELASPQARYRR